VQWQRRRGACAHPIGFRFERVILHNDQPGALRIADASGALLHDVRQFVAEQMMAARCVW
jgi:hypothetical protein